jgi:hypothetical protein
MYVAFNQTLGEFNVIVILPLFYFVIFAIIITVLFGVDDGSFLEQDIAKKKITITEDRIGKDDSEG